MAARFDYTPAGLASLVRDFRAGKLDLFPQRRPGPKRAPAKEAARARVIELRLAGHSIDEISAALAAEGTPLNRTGVSELIAEEGLPRIWRRPTHQRGPVRREQLPRAQVLDFGQLAAVSPTRLAGLLLAVPDLLTLDLPGLVRTAGYPSTREIPALSSILALLALKLTATRRVSHVEDLAADPAAALFAGLATLPKKSSLTAYSYRLDHPRQRAFLAALDTAMLTAGLAEGSVFDLDFHAVMHRGEDPVMERHYVPRRSQRTRSVLTFFAQDAGTHNLVYAGADLAKATQAREPIAFCDHWKQVSGADPAMLVLDQKVTTHAVLGELDQRGVKFLTLRMRSPSLVRHTDNLPATAWKTVTLDRDAKHRKPKVCEQHQVKLQRPHHPHQAAHRTLRPPHDHRATPRRGHPQLPPRRPILSSTAQRRPRRRPVRAGQRRLRSPAPPAARLPHRHPRHPATTLPRRQRADPQPRPGHHRPHRPAHPLTRPPLRQPDSRHRPLVGQPHPALRARLKLGGNSLRGNRR